MMSMQTNTTNTKLASTLAPIGFDGRGTLASLIIRKKGEVHGVQGNLGYHNNDKVHVLIWTGFHYKALVQRSYEKLQEMWGKGHLFHMLLQEGKAAGMEDVSWQDISGAVQGLNDNFLRVLRGTEHPDYSTENKSSTWQPLVVDGAAVLGSKVYTGENKLIKPSTVYLEGVKLGERVLEAAPSWEPKSRPQTVIKEILKRKLPIGLFVRYSLDPESLQEITIGTEAARHAQKAGVMVNPAVVQSLFKI